MTRVLALLVSLLLPSVAGAQTVTVRSGEHGDFTRLVFTIPEGTTWSIDSLSEDRQVLVAFGPEPLGFDTSSVFDRIGTNRISGLEPAEDGREMRISLACACDAEAFVLRETMLVLDVTPVPGETESPPRRRAVVRKPTEISPVIKDVLTLRLGDQAGIGPRAEDEAPSPFLPAALGPDLRAAGDPADHPRDPDGALGRRIAADLAIAATQGVLDPAVRAPASPADREPKTAEPADAPKTSAPLGDLTRKLADGLTSVTHDAMRDGRIAIGGENCVSDAALDISTWVNRNADPSDVLAARRTSLFGEFDRVQPEPLTDYAKALVHYGFGAEARAAMALQPEARDDLLFALSHLVDGETDPTGFFQGQAKCEGPAALWSLLSEVPPDGVSQEAIPAIQRSFEALPRGLRSHLGPKLAERFADAGEPMAAKAILRRTTRMEGEETDSIKLGAAQVALQNGDLEDAGHRLHELSVSGGAEAARAVAASVDLAASQGTDVPQRIVELAEAFSIELRNSEDGPRLWQAHVQALHLNGRFDEAFSELRSATKIPREAVDDSRRRALRSLVGHADDLTFLKIATRVLADGAFPETDALGLAFARRFLSLGLPEIALQHLDLLPRLSGVPDRQILRAEVLLALDRPEEAEVILIGQRGERVAELRAEARSRMGDHVLAASLLSEIGRKTDAIDAAWLSGDWAEVADSETALAPAAGLMRQDPFSMDPANANLATVEAVSETATRSRETLRSLLDTTEVPVEN